MANLIFIFLSGIGLFLFGIYTIDSAVNRENKLPNRIEILIKKPIFSLFFGFISAGLTQSSSAINSILTTLRDKDFIEEKISWFAVAGSNVGTTITAYFAVIDNNYISSFFSSLVFFATLGIMLIKDKKIRFNLSIVCGFSLIFISFSLIKSTIPEIVNMINLNFLVNDNPFIPFFITIILTATCQSSSLVSVIIVSLAKINALNLVNAVFMIMAANLGTCTTIFLVAIGKSKKSARVAIFNLLFNLIPTLIFIIFHYTNMLHWFYILNVSLDTKIALFHTLFNVVACLLICPFIDYFSIRTKNINQIENKKISKKTAYQ